MLAQSGSRGFATMASMFSVAALLAVGSPAAAAPTPSAPPAAGGLPQVTAQRRAIELVQPATVFVRVDWTANVDYGGQDPLTVNWTTACTGAIVSSDGYIVTAGHCTDAGSAGAKLDAIATVVDAMIAHG